MKFKLFFSYILMLALMSSCVTTASYNLFNGRADNKVKIYKEKKYVLINNNILTSDEDFNNKINQSFSDLIGDNVFIRYSNFFLEFDNSPFIKKLNLDENVLKGIKETSNTDYLILVRTFGKNNNGYSIKKEPLIRVEDISNYDLYREYHIILQLYDLKMRKLIYTKEAISVLNRVSYSTIAPTQISQLNQTYKKLFRDFKKSIQ
ncbi:MULTISPECIES: hypothetical protein [Elizabethkingia]|uniref:hypothetical protein n=1 Tax=Elizabethkingia TaxID=308865 RepID=UPI000A8D8CC6|nr:MULTISPECIES: hypothetical protein [Elizabethkingia]MDX8555781.1 hypothetical protein [Elizabethkingia sp. HX CGY]UXM66822.1 hypothetical protein N7E57_14540 [Elizabethkingia anophelis]CAH1137101.1 hypothetical protein EAVNVB490_00176 [Elizabethkingia anophelis]CAI9669018.1 hypothetical protein EAVNNN508_00176 [Elizabethkingia anophelis]CAI9675576.1 hypothetical protein EAVNVB490_02977 [Elizabethkingia anophelis]